MMHLLNDLGVDLSVEEIGFEISDNMEVARKKGKYFQEICAICYDDMSDGNRGRGINLSCGHSFHSICIDKWIQTKAVCPKCNAKIM